MAQLNLTLSLLFLLPLLSAYPFKNVKRWSANQKYAYTGQLSIDCSALPTDSQYAVTLPAAYINKDTKIYLTLIDLNMPLSSPNLTILPTVSDRSPSSLTVRIVRDNFTTILGLGVSYLLIRWNDELRKPDYNPYVVTQVDYSSQASSGTFDYNYPLGGLTIQKQWSSTFLTGFSIISASGVSSLALGVTAYMVSQSIMGVLGHFYQGSGNDRLAKLSMVVVILNKNRDASKAIVDYYSQDYLDTINKMEYVEAKLMNFNTFSGLSYAQKASSNFQFEISLGNNKISFKAALWPTRYVADFKSIITFYCDYTTPYYHSVLDQCFDVCPTNCLTDQLQLECRINPNTPVDPVVPTNPVQPTTEPSPSIGPIITIYIGSAIITVLLCFGIYVIFREKRMLVERERDREEKDENLRIEKTIQKMNTKSSLDQGIEDVTKASVFNGTL